MAGIDQIARPYAHAVYELAQDAGDLDAWSEALGFLAQVAGDPAIEALAQNPRIDRQQISQLIDDIAKDRVAGEVRNFIRLVVQNDRLEALPAIAAQFETLRAAAQGTVEAEVVSAQEVTEAQLAKLAAGLEKRLGRKVNLKVRRDETLLGGAIVRAGDLVIDGSARGHLQKLASSLAR